MISNVRLGGVAVTSMPVSFRAGYALSARAGHAVPARAGLVAAAHAGSAAAARVGAVAVAAAPAQRHLPIANAEWSAVAGIAPQRKRRPAATTPRASVDWSPT